MNSFDRILIIADNQTFMDADALRGVLQAFNLTVHLHRLLRCRQAEKFFASDFASGYDYLILCIHGMGRTEERIRMEIDLIDQKDGDYSAGDGWAPKPMIIRPTDVLRLFGRVRGHIIAMACGGGREAWGRAFLQTACRSYTGFDVGASEGSNWKAFLVFTINLFYFLLTETVIGDGRRHDMADAVRRAAATDPDYRLGTGGYRIYQRSPGREG